MARRSIWPRAKHRVGLERPHFCTRFRGQSDAWVAPAHIEISSDVLPVCVAGLKRRQVKEERKSGEEGKNNSVHFQNWHFFTRRSAHGIHSEAFSNELLCESYRAKKGKSGGSDPTFWRSIRPKVLSGSLPPVAAFRCACFFARGGAASLLAVKFSSSGEVGFTPQLHRYLTCYFTLDRARHYANQSDESSRRTKLCAAQTAAEVGATPLFGSQSAQKFCPGRSRPLLHSGAHVFSPRANQPRSWPSNSQVPVKWASPPNFTATSPATSPSIEHGITRINQMNRPEERNCARPRPRLRRERPHFLAVNPPKSFVRVAPARCCIPVRMFFRQGRISLAPGRQIPR